MKLACAGGDLCNEFAPPRLLSETLAARQRVVKTPTRMRKPQTHKNSRQHHRFGVWGKVINNELLLLLNKFLHTLYGWICYGELLNKRGWVRLKGRMIGLFMAKSLNERGDYMMRAFSQQCRGVNERSVNEHGQRVGVDLSNEYDLFKVQITQLSK